MSHELKLMESSPQLSVKRKPGRLSFMLLVKEENLGRSEESGTNSLAAAHKEARHTTRPRQNTPRVV